MKSIKKPIVGHHFASNFRAPTQFIIAFKLFILYLLEILIHIQYHTIIIYYFQLVSLIIFINVKTNLKEKFSTRILNLAFF